MVIYYPPNGGFSGYIYSIQGKLLDSIDAKYSQNNEYKNSYYVYNAFNHTSTEPSVDNDEYFVQFSLKKGNFFITHYEIQQRTDGYNSNLLKEWVFEGSNDEQTWFIIDKQNTDPKN